MAAFENKSGPDLDVYFGRSWLDWKNAVESDSVGSKIENNHSKQNKEVARLKRQDFRLFGYCPAKDDFYVVVCEHCCRPIKPQAFSFHIEKYHKDQSGKTSFPSSSSSRESLFSTLCALSCEPPSSKSPSLSKDHLFNSTAKGVLLAGDGKEKTRDKLLKPKSSKSGSSKRRLSQTEANKVSKSYVKVKQPKLDQDSLSKPSPVLKFTALNESDSGISLTLSSTKANSLNSSSGKLDRKNSIRMSVGKSPKDDSPSCKSALLSNGPVVVLENSLSARLGPHLYKASTSSSASIPSTSRNKQNMPHHNPPFVLVKSPGRGSAPTGPSSSHKNRSNPEVEGRTKRAVAVKNRDYDPNKHCGVIIEPDNIHCTRSLTCKNHARSLKRKVEGRQKPFDDLLMEHLRTKYKTKGRPETAATPPVTPSNRSGASDGNEGNSSAVKNSAKSPATNPPRAVTQPSNRNKSFLLFPRPSVCVVDRWQDSMQFEERNKDRNQLFSPRHPAPLMVCHFGSRKLSNNFCSFNRRVDYQWGVLTGINGGQARKPNFVESQNATSHFTSIPPMSAPTVTNIRRDMATRQRLPAPTNCVRTNFVPSLGLRRLFAKRSPHFCPFSAGDDFPIARSASTLRYESAQPGTNPTSNPVYVSVPLDSRLMGAMGSKLAHSRTATAPSFPSSVRLATHERHPAPHVISRDAPRQRFNSQPRLHNVHLNAKLFPNQILVKRELSPMNGLSNDVLATNQPVLQRPLPEARLQASYIFADETAALESADYDQIKLPRGRATSEHFTKIAHNSNNSNNLKLNASVALKFEPDAGVESNQQQLTDSHESQFSRHHTTVRVHPRPEQLSSASQDSTSDNWTSGFLSLPKVESVASTSTAQDFPFPLRENSINFSNDPASRTEIRNT